MKKATSGRRHFPDILEWLLLHLTFILSGIFITLWIINRFNPYMEFLTSRISNRLMIVYFSTAFLSAGFYIVRRAGRLFRRNGLSSPSGAFSADRRKPSGDPEAPNRTKATREPTLAGRKPGVTDGRKSDR